MDFIRYKIIFYPLLVIFASLLSCNAPKQEEQDESPEKELTYKADWESLKKHNEAPEWFANAKLGIYFHWGVYSVPAFGNEWYPRHMHFENRKEYKHHLEKYGHPSEFGYHDFVPMFTAEHFDAKEWVELFKKSGARFAGPVAEHHDGFSMWDSEITPWNSMDKGPKKDILGELSKEIKASDMKLIATFHHARHLQRHNSTSENPYWNSHYPFFEGMPPSSEDEELKYLYGNIPEEQWNREVWMGKLVEVIDKYQPDIMWFDSWLDEIPESYRQEFCAYYLNEAEKWGKEVVIVRKQDDLPLDVSVDDLEKSRKNRLEEKVWMTDETISKGSWCYTEDLKIKPAGEVLHVLIDIVSKNGVLLLNISPKADGTIPEDQRTSLLEMGNWLSNYGEAIYDTKPWYTYGEGPTKEPEGHFKNHAEFLKIKYSEKDYRFTAKGDNIYVMTLGAPQANEEILLTSFSRENLPEPVEISKISLLGNDAEIEWSLTDEGLKISIPATDLDEMAVVFKVEKK
ncbi:alpha-L-fucosidase [Flexithrix dorotheae]|uniref:alpha-L-fucosidase n=1 Tax=Flexithrix dorotheae TaxID=70993 RepID=UPI0012F87584|nr:alpha-L-fucosidase [Flexithrix dorotheae]